MKRISFFLTLVFTAALGSLFVASAQDADEPAAPTAPADAAPADEAPADDAAPADETPAPIGEAPADDEPVESAPADEPEPVMDEPEAPADEPEPVMDEPESPPSDEPAPGDEPAMGNPGDEPEGPAMDEPTGEPEGPAMDEPEGPAMAEPADEAPVDEAPGEDAAPADPVPVEAAPAPVKAAKKASALSSLRISDGEAELERQTANAEPLRARLAKGQAAGLTNLDTALLGADAGGVARFGGCEVTLSEHTTFKVLSVGAEVSVVEILGIELEMTRGTILEAAFGSLSVTVRAGNTTARNTSGVPQTLQMNVGGSSYTVSVPAATAGGTPAAISVDASGNVTTNVPITIMVSRGGRPPIAMVIQPGTALGGTQAAALGALLVGQADNFQAADGPPSGTVPGTKSASNGVSGN